MSFPGKYPRRYLRLWRRNLQQRLKNYFVAGLLVIIPLATTIWLMVEVATRSINFLTSIPKQLNPVQGMNPFLVNTIDLSVGLLAPFLFILLIGFMARNIVGEWLLGVSEKLLNRIPIAGSVYKTLKQLLTTLFSSRGKQFSRVVLVEYPRKGAWSIGFVTSGFSASLGQYSDRPWLSVFVPTTPNPTSGWYAIVPEADTVSLSMSVEDAFKLLISGGIVAPESFQNSLMNPETMPEPPAVPNLKDLVKEEIGREASRRSLPPDTPMREVVFGREVEKMNSEG
ncbi:MAG: DUF502 domain-containing protein [Cyanobacteria bacterium J06642_2]